MEDSRKSASYCPENRQIALFLDLDNFNLNARGKEITLLLAALQPWGKVAIRRAYGRSPAHRRDLHEQLLRHRFVIEQCPCIAGKKNGADIRITVEIMEMLYTRPGIRTFALASGDSDFLALIQRLHEHNCSVIGTGGRKTSSSELVRSCDRFLFFDDFVASIDTRRSGEITNMSTPFRCDAEAMRTVLRRRNLYPPDPHTRKHILHCLSAINAHNLTFRDLQQEVIALCEPRNISRSAIRHCLHALTRSGLLVANNDSALSDRRIQQIPAIDTMQKAISRLLTQVLLAEENVLIDPLAMAEAIWDDTARTDEMEKIVAELIA